MAPAPGRAGTNGATASRRAPPGSVVCPPMDRPRSERFSHASIAPLHLHALHWGGDGAPLVLLHGSGANAHWWDHLAPALAERFHVVALDFRGHGDADHPEEVAPGAFQDDLRALLAHLGRPDAALVGHSLGAHVALGHAAGGGSPRAIALLDLTRGAGATTKRAARLALILRRAYPDRERAIDRFRFLPDAPYVDEELRRSVAAHSIAANEEGRFAFKFDPRWFSIGPGERPDARRVQCPTLLLRGAESTLLSEEGAAAWQREIPDCRLVELPRAGHNLHMDQPEATLRELLAFL